MTKIKLNKKTDFSTPNPNEFSGRNDKSEG